MFKLLNKNQKNRKKQKFQQSPTPKSALKVKNFVNKEISI